MIRISVKLLLLVVISTQISHGVDKHCHNETRRCYWLGAGSKSWDAARTACQSEGGDLAVMETEELWNFTRNEFTFR